MAAFCWNSEHTFFLNAANGRRGFQTDVQIIPAVPDGSLKEKHQGNQKNTSKAQYYPPQKNVTIGSCSIQHISDEDTVAGGWVRDHDMGDGADNAPVLDDGGAGQE